MQTFLPFPDARLSAEVLDNRRLNKQRFEAQQIYVTLGVGGHYRNHPATKMWSDNRDALLVYGLAICNECDRRNLADNDDTKQWFVNELKKQRVNWPLPGENFTITHPWWFGHPVFHHSHALALLYKDWNWYRGRLTSNWSPLPSEPITTQPEYVWPIHRREIANIQTKNCNHWTWPTGPDGGVQADVLLGTRYVHPKVFSGRLRIVQSPHMVLDTKLPAGKPVKFLLENGKDLL